MSKRIDKAQLDLAKEMRAAGHSWEAIAAETGASVRGLRYNAEKNGWNNKPKTLPIAGKQKGKEVAKLDKGQIEELAELVQSQLAVDIETTAKTLANWQPSELDLPQLEKRERIAESVQKRAANLFDIGKSDQSVVNIAVLSQLPDAVEA